ncbi:hypothetical protein VOLCADRAFT_108501 [Volvox carteri f. nagariensis]|uniref:Uncharacterized protein n=1 Tax=Volvox carteri f. nagariensis TaxID=3068 RepID=D8UKH2_VOLCA|nr:uncharacterized protein VOLCADRAFT_108501 [Volvox carteri f. nagariensis]EFJ39774.1 hypothetical protein VOLCADRAFT_108501 [Volvox carteri f. nagariensis]|eukprot:XP_002959151.1 hypothetical protein VOLCADRAFT_108501 [Volvox carteri f. nagariensis]
MRESLIGSSHYRALPWVRLSTQLDSKFGLTDKPVLSNTAICSLYTVGLSKGLTAAASARVLLPTRDIRQLFFTRRLAAAVTAPVCILPARWQRFRGQSLPIPGAFTCGILRQLARSPHKNSVTCRDSSNSSCGGDYRYFCYDEYWPPVPVTLGPIPVGTGDSPAAVSDYSNSTLQQPLPPVVTFWPQLEPTASNTTTRGSSSSSSTSEAAIPVGAELAASIAMQAAAEDPFNMDLLEVAASCAPPVATATAAASDRKTSPAVDVTRHNFEVMLPMVRRYLASCDFFAFDCEMTGLFLDGQTENYLDDMQDRYTRTAAAAQSFIITQFGLSCFRRQPEPGPGGEARYLAATFNFYLFPRPPEGAAFGSSRRFLCDAGSLSFLASQLDRENFSNNANNGGGGGGGEVPRADVALTNPGDQEFVQNLVASVRDWLASGSSQPLDLPPVNRYLRLLTYQALARPENFGGPPGGSPDWQPGFVVKKVNGERNMTLVRLVRCGSAAEAAALEAAEQAEKRAGVAAAAGFAAVWEAMRECGRPAVGHNCMFDVAYGISQFGEGRLPATWEGFKRAVAHWFRGGLYDTKHICRQLPELLGSDTMLAVMYGSLVPQNSVTSGTGPLPARVSISHARGFEKYVAVAAGELAHEAGYDAFMTGSVFAALEAVMAVKGVLGAEVGEGMGAAAGRMEVEAADLTTEETEAPAVTGIDAGVQVPYVSLVPYVWRLNVTRSDLPFALLRPTVPGDPATLEPVPERPLVFHLGTLSHGVRANDIHRAFEEAGLGKGVLDFGQSRDSNLSRNRNTCSIPICSITTFSEKNRSVDADSVIARILHNLSSLYVCVFPHPRILHPGPQVECEVAATRLREEQGLLEERRLCAEVLPYVKYRARKDEMLAAGTWPLPGYGSGYGGARGGYGGSGGVLGSRPAAAAGAGGRSAPPPAGTATTATVAAVAAGPSAEPPVRPGKRLRVDAEEEVQQQQPTRSALGQQCVMM